MNTNTAIGDPEFIYRILTKYPREYEQLYGYAIKSCMVYWLSWTTELFEFELLYIEPEIRLVGKSERA